MAHKAIKFATKESLPKHEAEEFEGDPTSISYLVVEKLATALKVSTMDASRFLLGDAEGEEVSGTDAEDAATAMGFTGSIDSYDEFWSKVFTPIEFKVAQALAFGDDIGDLEDAEEDED